MTTFKLLEQEGVKTSQLMMRRSHNLRSKVHLHYDENAAFLR